MIAMVVLLRDGAESARLPQDRAAASPDIAPDSAPFVGFTFL
jgi:hypothetical protein